LNFNLSLSFEVIRGLQILAAIVVLIWFRDRIAHPKRFGWSLVLVCAGALITAVLFMAGVDLTPKPGETGAFRMLGFVGLIEGFSLFFFFFAFLEFPWDITRWSEPDKPEPKPRPAAKKTTTRKKKKTGGSKG
jgi:hypothetical protein